MKTKRKTYLLLAALLLLLLVAPGAQANLSQAEECYSSTCELVDKREGITVWTLSCCTPQGTREIVQTLSYPEIKLQGPIYYAPESQGSCNPYVDTGVYGVETCFEPYQTLLEHFQVASCGLAKTRCPEMSTYHLLSVCALDGRTWVDFCVIP